MEERLADHPVDVAIPADLPAGPRRCQPDRAGARQPARQRGEVHACRHARRIRGARRRRLRARDVDDEGPGLPAGERERLFDKFQRGSDEGTIAGAGLGLAICRAIVRSARRRRSRRAPARRRRALRVHAADLGARRRDAGDASGPRRSRTTPASATCCACCSQAEQLSRHRSGDGGARRDRGAQRTSRICCSSISGLPDGDGLEVIRRVRAWSPVPIIVLSARTMEAQKIAALDAGADDYVTKPFSAPELLARVRAALRRSVRGAEQPPSLQLGRVDDRSRAARSAMAERRGASDAARVPRARECSRATRA